MLLKKNLWSCLSYSFLVVYLWVTSNFDLVRFRKVVCSFLSKAFPESFITPGAPPCLWQVHTPQHFCTCQGTFLFWVPQTGGSLLLPCVFLWACPWPAPPSSSVTSVVQEQWTDFLPRGCIRKPPMKSTEITAVLTEVETRRIGTWVTQMCQQKNLIVSHQWKDRRGSTRLFLHLFLLLNGCPPPSQRHDKIRESGWESFIAVVTSFVTLNVYSKPGSGLSASWTSPHPILPTAPLKQMLLPFYRWENRHSKVKRFTTIPPPHKWWNRNATRPYTLPSLP